MHRGNLQAARIASIVPNDSGKAGITAIVEWLLLGAAVVHHESKLLWGNAKGEIANNKDANQWVKPTYRKGW